MNLLQILYDTLYKKYQMMPKHVHCEWASTDYNTSKIFYFDDTVLNTFKSYARYKKNHYSSSNITTPGTTTHYRVSILRNEP